MTEDDKPYHVGDNWPDGNRHPEPGTILPTLGTFATEDEAAAFIESLPDHLEGRYSLDGPSDDAAEPITESIALDYAIFAINTWMHPDASNPLDVEALEQNEAAVITVLAGMRRRLQDPYGEELDSVLEQIEAAKGSDRQQRASLGGELLYIVNTMGTVDSPAPRPDPERIREVLRRIYLDLMDMTSDDVVDMLKDQI